MAAQRLLRTVACEEAAEFAARRLDRRVRFTRRWRKSLGENFEVVDERFHLCLHLFTSRRNDARSFRAERSFRGKLLHRLADNLQALAHLRDADEVAREAISLSARGYVKFKFFVA